MLGAILGSAAAAAAPWLLEKIYNAFTDGDQQQQNQGMGSGMRQLSGQGGIDPYQQEPAADMWWGNPERVAHIPLFTNQQLPLLQMLGQQGQQQFMNPYSGFEDIAKQATENFNQNTIPSLAERFTSMGQNSLTSPLFASQMGQAGAQMNTQLAAMKQMYGNQNRSQALEMLGMGLAPQYQNLKMAAQPGAVSSFMQLAMPALVNAGGEFAKQGIKSYWKQPEPKPEGV